MEKDELKKIYNGAELVEMKIDMMPTLIDPIIPKVGVIALIGTSDIGKSSLLLQLCSDIVIRKTFLDFPVKCNT